MHRDIHDKFTRFGMESQKMLLDHALLPGGRCPFCERSIDEQPGPILEVDGVSDRVEWPTLEPNDVPQPRIEDLIGHERKHGACGFDHSSVPHDSE